MGDSWCMLLTGSQILRTNSRRSVDFLSWVHLKSMCVGAVVPPVFLPSLCVCVCVLAESSASPPRPGNLPTSLFVFVVLFRRMRLRLRIEVDAADFQTADLTWSRLVQRLRRLRRFSLPERALGEDRGRK